ncbi:QacE family quaternary ammonium compound efflux SMR transporter [Paenibacillus sp. CAA11]|uniref:DMT family transporter n=1 Tax=Paenibacillus sp. CAA11 TaxID=1532905 RepID=UPI000D3A9383|nr:multidrug efflux SMR transporter [Paenibacillus sp. CAA11]AWB46296.1 QacE family quaternary ammonium compound efflux SMR transporter [Paenibacillus sp. CAA11]
MAWLALVLAGGCEVLGVIGIKRVTLRRDLLSYLLLFGSFVGSFSLLSFAMKTLPMGTAYAVWTGIGTVGSTLVGMLLFGEPKEARRLLCIALILGAAVGLKLIS